MNDAPSEKQPALWQITTQWSQVNNPVHFVIRYSEAVRRYLSGWLPDRHAVDDVLQELLLQATEHGFQNADPAVGRFRDYLLVVVRNAARKSLRRTGRTCQPLTEVLVDQLEAPDTEPSAALDEAWLREWRSCLLDRAMRALHALEIDTPGNRYHTVLRLATEKPDADQRVLAAELSQRLGRPISHDAFRQMLGRARRQFALFLVREVAATLNAPNAAEVEEELAALELLARIERFLPSDWRTRPEWL